MRTQRALIGDAAAGQELESRCLENEPGPLERGVESSRGSSWVRPGAVAVFVLSLVSAMWVIWRTEGPRETPDVALNFPALALVIVLATVAVMALAVVMFRPERGDLAALVATSAAWSLSLFAAVIVAWVAVAVADRQDQWHGTPIASLAEADAYLARHLPPGSDPVRIPTGVLIQSMEFLSGDNVQVTGFVWQRYGPELPADLVRGVVFAEGVEEAYDAEEAYRYEENGVETIGWYFAATLRQPFDYTKFPFDKQDLWIRLWSRDFNRDVVLVPDFAAFHSLDAKVLPGIEEEFVYSGWIPLYSGFSYSMQRYNTSFGIGDAPESYSYPELYFNLVLDRHFVGPFFEHIVFAIAVACLLFGLLVITTDDEQLKGRFQLSTAGVLGAASGLLFAVILKHNQLRAIVGTQGISYIEAIPIVLYGVIVGVVLNAILVASPLDVRVVRHRNNLWPVLAYWPVLSGFLLAATLIVFFSD
jgi:hypothetical protein